MTWVRNRLQGKPVQSREGGSIKNSYGLYLFVILGSFVLPCNEIMLQGSVPRSRELRLVAEHA